MGDLIHFPPERPDRSKPHTGRPAAVLVLPVIAIERDPAVLARLGCSTLVLEGAELLRQYMHVPPAGAGRD